MHYITNGAEPNSSDPIHSHLLVSSEPDGSEGGPSELQASRVLLPDLGSSRFRCSLIHQSCACSHPEINMFKNTFQSGFLSILYSLGSKPLQIWDKEIANGQIKRPQDDDIQSNVLEIVGSNVQSTYITCPADPAATLGIKLPFLVMIVKNLKKYFTFEIQVLDDKNVRRRFRASNFQVFCYTGQAIHLHHASEARRWMEQYSMEPC
ncbi:uncharacterized protein [Elaeis guineensis]|uniref:uncharacterized protein isoform X3 n=1 Tax=Elaeis guineensis var. tenera TaxID=51953 RepID=UPI003C6D4E5F